MTDLDPQHIDAVARHAAGPNPPAIPGPSWLAAQSIHERHLIDFLNTNDPAVHAAMLDALTRHGVLTVEEAWVPVAESGERWKRRDKDTARRDLSGWPAGGCYTSGDPWDGITHIERETRHVSQWEVAP